MAAIITSKFRFHNAEQFKESFSEAAPTNYYLFIGRPSAFASGTTGGSDSAPPTPVDNRRSEAFHWDDMLAAKKIDSTGVTHAIPRRDLDVSGATTYDMYRPNYSASNTTNSGATSLFDSTFYFMTSAYRVYKVLENKNNGAWTAAEPTSTDKNPFAAGGYTIKYMFTLTTTQVQNFLTPDFIPVLTAGEGGKALADGELSVVKITTAGLSLVGGSAWNVTSDRTVANVPIRGDGTGALCSVKIGGTDGSADGTITECTIGSGLGGSGYTHATILAADIIEQHNIQHSGGALTFSSNPVFEVVIGPDGGHGSNPARELGGHFCLTDTKLQQTEAFDFSVVNDFRQIGIVRSPYSYGTTSAFTGSTARQTKAVKLASNSGTFQVDEKISQTIAPVDIATSNGMTASGNVITVNTASAHQLQTGQMVKIVNGTWSGSPNNGHQGTHHITRTSATQFTFTVAASRQPASGASFTVGSAAYTTFAPQGIVVEWDATNKILFYVQNSYDNQGTDATYKQTIPFSGNSTITGATSNATGVPDVASSATVNNTVFVGGYANPELQPDSGDVIYIENRKPISRASDQTEDVKLVVEF